MVLEVQGLDFIEAALLGDSPWDAKGLESLASRTPPDAVLGRRAALLRADIHREWVRWFAHSMADPTLLARTNAQYAHVFAEVFANVTTTFTGALKDELIELAGVVSSYLLREVEFIRRAKKRATLSRADKLSLLDIQGSSPRCWVTGWKFEDSAIDAFLGDYSGDRACPLFVDAVRPIGLNVRDTAIEVDHVIPFSRSSADEGNLRLASGWANVHKSSYVCLYDTGSYALEAHGGGSSLTTLPRPFWTIRLLGTRTQCEHKDGCQNTSYTSELTVERVNTTGAFVPTNLRVTCLTHDSMRDIRYLPRAEAADLWKGTRFS